MIDPTLSNPASRDLSASNSRDEIQVNQAPSNEDLNEVASLNEALQGGKNTPSSTEIQATPSMNLGQESKLGDSNSQATALKPPLRGAPQGSSPYTAYTELLSPAASSAAKTRSEDSLSPANSMSKPLTPAAKTRSEDSLSPANSMSKPLTPAAKQSTDIERAVVVPHADIMSAPIQKAAVFDPNSPDFDFSKWSLQDVINYSQAHPENKNAKTSSDQRFAVAFRKNFNNSVVVDSIHSLQEINDIYGDN